MKPARVVGVVDVELLASSSVSAFLAAEAGLFRWPSPQARVGRAGACSEYVSSF
jgi:hypothetical protein